MAKVKPLKNRPWFAVNGQPGDRTLEQQLIGLKPLFAEVRGKTVFDVGCAEGLIAIELAKAGASRVTGLEVREFAVRAANMGTRGHPAARLCKFFSGDANTHAPTEQFDIVLMLAVLHKLKDPATSCARLAAAARELVVIRLPPATAPVVVDKRSGNKQFDIDAVMRSAGFVFDQMTMGPFGEWVGYYRRPKAVADE